MKTITIALIEKGECPLDDKLVVGIRAEVEEDKEIKCIKELEKVLDKYSYGGTHK